MKILMYIGATLLALGIAGVIWGLVAMNDDRDTLDFGGNAQIVVDKGQFPPIGVAGAIGGGIGLAMVGVGGIGYRKH